MSRNKVLLAQRRRRARRRRCGPASLTDFYVNAIVRQFMDEFATEARRFNQTYLESVQS